MKVLLFKSFLIRFNVFIHILLNLYRLIRADPETKMLTIIIQVNFIFWVERFVVQVLRRKSWKWATWFMMMIRVTCIFNLIRMLNNLWRMLLCAGFLLIRIVKSILSMNHVASTMSHDWPWAERWSLVRLMLAWIFIFHRS